MDKKIRLMYAGAFAFIFLMIIGLSYFVLAQENPISILGDFGYSGMEISEIKIEGDGPGEIKIEPGDKIEVGGKEIKFEEVVSFSQEGIYNFRYIKQLINLSQFDDVGFTGAVSFSQKIKIDYDKIRWNGTEYELTSTPVYLIPWIDNETEELIVPNIFIDNVYNKRVNYKDVAEVGGYAIAYEDGGKYFIELIIEEIDYSILSDYIVDPLYFNQTDGFDVSAVMSFPSGMDGDGSDFWIVGGGVDFVFHFNSSGDNQSDGFYVGDEADGPYGVTTNGSDFWVVEMNPNEVFHYNSTGDNQGDGFSLDAVGAISPRGIVTTNGSDFWIVESGNRLIVHSDDEGNELPGGFSVSGAVTIQGMTYIMGTDFWVIDHYSNDFVHHLDYEGNNLSDGFHTSALMGSQDPAGIATNGSDLWIVDDVDDFVYHLSPLDYFIDIIDPTTASPKSVNGSDNITITFNFTENGVFVTSGVTLHNVTIGGVFAEILSYDMCDGTPSDCGTYETEPPCINGTGCSWGEAQACSGTGSCVDTSVSACCTEGACNWAGKPTASCQPGIPTCSGIDDQTCCEDLSCTWGLVSSCSGVPSACSTYSNNSTCAFAGCDWSPYQQFWYADGIGWKINITVPTDSLAGLQDLFLNATYFEATRTETEIDAISYPVVDTCTYSSGNWEVNCSDGCNITSTVNLNGNNISIIGVGTFITNVSIHNWTGFHIEGINSSDRCIVTCKQGGCFDS